MLGKLVGSRDGYADGNVVGIDLVGTLEGRDVGILLGPVEGDFDGILDGIVEENGNGSFDGRKEGF